VLTLEAAARAYVRCVELEEHASSDASSASDDLDIRRADAARIAFEIAHRK
jgi:hypothetical protein